MIVEDAGHSLATILPYLHLARRSGSLAVGHSAVKRCLSSGKCRLVIMAVDAGGSMKRLDLGSVLTLNLGTREELGGWLDRDEVSILGLTDPNLVTGITKRMKTS